MGRQSMAAHIFVGLVGANSGTEAMPSAALGATDLIVSQGRLPAMPLIDGASIRWRWQGPSPFQQPRDRLNVPDRDVLWRSESSTYFGQKSGNREPFGQLAKGRDDIPPAQFDDGVLILLCAPLATYRAAPHALTLGQWIRNTPASKGRTGASRPRVSRRDDAGCLRKLSASPCPFLFR